MTELSEVLGRSKKHEKAKNYKASDEYADQGEFRIVKDLMFVYHVLEPNPMLPGAGDIVAERTATTGQAVDVEELGPLYLEKGERLGSFFTDAELRALRPAQVRDIFQRAGGIHESIKELVGASHATSGDEAEAEDKEFSLMSSHELAEYMEENKPTVAETVAMADGDPEAAKRILEAEDIVTDNDPRQGVIDGLSRIIGEGN